MYDNTINVLMIAIRSDSQSVSPDFSPKAFAHNLQNLFNGYAFHQKRRQSNKDLHHLYCKLCEMLHLELRIHHRV